MSVNLSEQSIFAAWPGRLRSATIILLVAVLMIGALCVFGTLTLTQALIVIAAIMVAALVPWSAGGDLQPSRDDVTSTTVHSPVVEAVLAGMPDPAVLLDRAGRVIHINPAAALIAPALRRNEMAQITLRTPEIVTALREAMVTKQSRRITYLDHGEIPRWLELFIVPVNVPTAFGGTDCYLLMTFHDLTQQRRVEEMRVDFVANASHELRTPLAALSGFIDTLQGPAKNDDRARERFLEIMHSQAARMGRLIDDLLSLSRVEFTAHVRPELIVDLAQIIRQEIDGLEPLARDRGVTIHAELGKEPLLVAGDREELLRLFENLIENALKYGASGERIEIDVTRAVTKEGRHEIRVAVRDFGPGIPPEHLPRLTERFYRVNNGASRAQGGTGLGLSLVKHIVSRHGGRLQIESIVNQGAAFTAVFPQAEGRLDK